MSKYKPTAEEARHLWEYNSSATPMGLMACAAALEGENILKALEDPSIEDLHGIVRILVRRMFPQVTTKFIVWTDYPFAGNEKQKWVPVEVHSYDDDKYVKVITQSGDLEEVKLGYLYLAPPAIAEQHFKLTHEKITHYLKM